MNPLREAAGIVLAIPVLGVLLGGVYSLPAGYLTNERDPWYTLLLACGLAVTTFGVGLLAGVPFLILLGVWGVSLVLFLLARWVFGDLGIERFGMVHAATLMLTAYIALGVRLLALRPS
jgi:hypothetical protein